MNWYSPFIFNINYKRKDLESHICCCFVEKERKKSGGNMEKFCFGWICLFIVRWTRDFVGFWFFWRKIFDQKRQKNMGVQNQIYAHKIKLVGSTKRVVEKSRILLVWTDLFRICKDLTTHDLPCDGFNSPNRI